MALHFGVTLSLEIVHYICDGTQLTDAFARQITEALAAGIDRLPTDVIRHGNAELPEDLDYLIVEHFPGPSQPGESQNTIAETADISSLYREQCIRINPYINPLTGRVYAPAIPSLDAEGMSIESIPADEQVLALSRHQSKPHIHTVHFASESFNAAALPSIEELIESMSEQGGPIHNLLFRRYKKRMQSKILLDKCYEQPDKPTGGVLKGSDKVTVTVCHDNANGATVEIRDSANNLLILPRYKANSENVSMTSDRGNALLPAVYKKHAEATENDKDLAAWDAYISGLCHS